VDLHGPGVTFQNRQAVFYGSTPQDLRLVARTGGPAPGLPGLTFKGNEDDDVQSIGADSNALGQVVLSGDLSDDTRALYVGRPDNLRLIARTGQPAPGGVSATVASIGQPVLGDGGFLAMTAELRDSPSGPSSTALYAGPPEALRLVARGGTRAPGTPDGVTFSGFGFALHPDSNGGFVGVEAHLSGPGVNETNDQAVLAADPAGTLYLLAREGDSFLVAPGDVRTVLVTAPPNGPSAAGETTFRLRFTDGSEGLFVATVPEPAGAGLFAAGAALLLSRRRRRQFRQ
jgi:hypothetical protein